MNNDVITVGINWPATDWAELNWTGTELDGTELDWTGGELLDWTSPRYNYSSSSCTWFLGCFLSKRNLGLLKVFKLF